MSKEKKGNKEAKKAPLMTAKEKRAAKKAKKSPKGVFDDYYNLHGGTVFIN